MQAKKNISKHNHNEDPLAEIMQAEATRPRHSQEEDPLAEIMQAEAQLGQSLIILSYSKRINLDARAVRSLIKSSRIRWHSVAFGHEG